MLKTGQIIDTEITSLSSEGMGVGRQESFVVFVPFALPGERATVIITKIKQSHAFSELLKILRESKQRTIPVCPIFHECGGCDLQHLSYEGQLAFKTQKVRDALERIGGIKGADIRDTIGMDHPYHYRNHVRLQTGMKADGSIGIGFYQRKSHDVADMQECFIAQKETGVLAEITRSCMKENGWDAHAIKGVLLRTSRNEEEKMVILEGAEKTVPRMEEYVKKLQGNLDGLKSVIIRIGKEEKLLYGMSGIQDETEGIRFTVSPSSFLQVNHLQTEKLYKAVLDDVDLKSEETVVDAYCGIGILTLMLGKKGKNVVGIEISEQAIQDAMANKTLNEADNVSFIKGKCEDILPKLISNGLRPDVMILDPPRQGCDVRLLESLSESGVKKVEYVSCDPASLSRDLKILLSYGYEIEKVQPVDMFPQTHHVETVVSLQKKDSLKRIEE